MIVNLRTNIHRSYVLQEKSFLLRICRSFCYEIFKLQCSLVTDQHQGLKIPNENWVKNNALWWLIHSTKILKSPDKTKQYSTSLEDTFSGIFWCYCYSSWCDTGEGRNLETKYFNDLRKKNGEFKTKDRRRNSRGSQTQIVNSGGYQSYTGKNRSKFKSDLSQKGHNLS